MVNLDHIRKLADEGYSQATVAEIVGVSRQRVHQIAKAKGVAFVSGAHNYDLDDAVAGGIARGLTAREIESETGISYATVIRSARRQGQRLNKRPKRSKHEAALRECAALGLTTKETAAKLGIGKESVSAVCARLGIKLRDGRRRND